MTYVWLVVLFKFLITFLIFCLYKFLGFFDFDEILFLIKMSYYYTENYFLCVYGIFKFCMKVYLREGIATFVVFVWFFHYLRFLNNLFLHVTLCLFLFNFNVFVILEYFWRCSNFNQVCLIFTIVFKLLFVKFYYVDTILTFIFTMILLDFELFFGLGVILLLGYYIIMKNCLLI